jgi:hypothetical protein
MKDIKEKIFVLKKLESKNMAQTRHQKCAIVFLAATNPRVIRPDGSQI